VIHIKKKFSDRLEIDRKKRKLIFYYKDNISHSLSVNDILDLVELKVNYDDVTLSLNLEMLLWRKNDVVELIDLPSIVNRMKYKLNIDIELIGDFFEYRRENVSIEKTEDGFIINEEYYTPQNFDDELDEKK